MLRCDVRGVLPIVTNEIISISCLPLYSGIKHTWGIREKRRYRIANVHEHRY